jgi:hypothetical protein
MYPKKSSLGTIPGGGIIKLFNGGTGKILSGGVYIFVINEFRIGGRVIKLGGGIFDPSGGEYCCVGGGDKIDW